MSKLEKVIKGLECCKRKDGNECKVCPYTESEYCTEDMVMDVLALLKEDCHNCKLECLLQKYDELKEKYDALLKEQETKTGKWIPIESPTGVEAFGVKEMTVMNVRCSVCGSEEDVSFTGYKYCPRCGAKMEGR